MVGKIRAGSRMTRLREEGIWRESGEGGRDYSEEGLILIKC